MLLGPSGIGKEAEVVIEELSTESTSFITITTSNATYYYRFSYNHSAITNIH